jgi:hypothetical protein
MLFPVLLAAFQTAPPRMVNQRQRLTSPKVEVVEGDPQLFAEVFYL